MKAAYLSGHHLATTSIRMMLEECFGKQNVYEHSFDEIDYIHERDYDLLVLPGIAGEHSPYPSRMGEKEKLSLKQAVEEKGMILWTDCAATYLMCNNIEYHASNGDCKKIQGLGFIDGVARGPVSGETIAPDPHNRFRDVVIKRVQYNTDKTADICYGNGPGLFLSDTERNSEMVDVIGWYHNVDGAPVAAMSKRIGHGLLISLGVLVQIGPSHIQGPPLSDSNDERHRSALFNHLSTHDEQRMDFLNILLNTAMLHYQSKQLYQPRQHKNLFFNIGKNHE